MEQDFFDGIQGGFTRPQFNPGSGVSGSRVSAEIAALDGTRAEFAERDDQLHQEKRDEGRRRRSRLGISIGAAVLVAALIVFAMVRLWADDRWGLAAALL